MKRLKLLVELYIITDLKCIKIYMELKNDKNSVRLYMENMQYC